MNLSLDEPSSGPQFCLKWNNHPANFSGTFDRLRSEGHFTDVSLGSMEGEVVHAHRIVLSASSRYLESMLRSVPAVTDHTSLVLPQIRHQDLVLLVAFMYTGEAAVEQERLKGLLEAASALKIRGLCEEEKDDDEEEDENNATREEDRLDSIRTSLDSALFSQQQQQEEPSIPSPVMESEPQLPVEPTAVVKNRRKRKQTPKQQQEQPIKVPKLPDFRRQLPQLPVPISMSSLISQITNSSTDSYSSAPLGQLPVTATAALLASAAAQLPFVPTPTAALIQQKLPSPICSRGSSSTTPSPPPSTATPSRKYKNYSDDDMTNALAAIKGGQSINQSSHIFGIPPRTLRDRMKALNIVSKYTHHNNNGSVGGRRNQNCKVEKENVEQEKPEYDLETLIQAAKLNMSKMASSHMAVKEEETETEEEEEEIDDDEEQSLLIDENKA